MSLDQTSPAPSTAFKIGLWVLRILSAFPFLAGAVFKLTSNPMMVEEFEKFGLGQWFRYFTAIVEGAGAILTLIPATSPFGLLVLLGVDAGAGVANISIGGDIIHVLIIAVILAVTLYLQRSRLLSLIGR